MNNLIVERSKEGKCPICNQDCTSGEVTVEEYNGGVVIIHSEHIKYGERK